MFERLGCCDPLGWVDGQHLVNEIFGFGSHRVPLRRRKLRREEETPQWIPAQKQYISGVIHISMRFKDGSNQ